MNQKRKFATIIIIVVIVITFFSGCKGDEMDIDNITWKYQKQIEEVTINNISENDIYVDFNVIILNKDKEILYKEDYFSKLLKVQEVYSIDLEDVKPEYISYDKVDSMEIEVLKVYEVNKYPYYLFFIGVIALAILSIRHI